MSGLDFHPLNVDKTLKQETLLHGNLFVIYAGLWLGPQTSGNSQTEKP
jgi:hypothetical protein